MCHSCKDCGDPRNCKTELRRRLVRALEIVDGMKEDSFTLKEAGKAVELYDLLENVQRDHVPHVKAWCSVKVYAKVHGQSEAESISAHSPDRVWRGYATKKVAEREAALTQAHYKIEHEKHPWWGPWKTCGDKFEARLTECSVSDLRSGWRLDREGGR
jgi:hypothetical protein